ncbi:hypothetical protein SPI_02094 [Niveomyces insectorum RCEF 264]|uniref:Uncharacterized protein n=1 Tax=Niveomyces insectorum RCEF 264 TaxID=1081102 RepID=A0A167XRW1_9HYPO|nr:hypothetical protein SPI_02094 [Niveomyces insectorum RCEF 264]
MDPSLARVEFPTVMNIYSSWSHPKHFYICGDTKDEKLFYIEIHTGVSGKGLLGNAHGYEFHRGPTKEDPVVAAVGYESYQAASMYQFNSDSVVVLPPYDPYNPKSTFMTAEKMPASTTPEKRAVFSFSIEVGRKMLREKFEWRQFNKDEDTNAEVGGFKLVRLSPRYWRSGSNSDGGKSNSPTKAAEDNSEVVAILAWTKGWFGHSNVLSTHPFTLRLVGSGKLGHFGNRWALMTVLTALRIYDLHKIGRTKYTSIRIGEKLRRGDAHDQSREKPSNLNK